IHERIPITAPARTLLDIARELDSRELERAFDEALALRLISLGGVRAMLERYPQRAGSAPLRGLLDPDRATTATRSSGEELMLALTRRGGLDPPEVNVRVGRWTVDFLWRRERVIVEVDGFDFHRGRWAFERDRRKDGELHAAGFLVIRVTMLQLRHEPEVVLVRIASALARRAPAA